MTLSSTCLVTLPGAQQPAPKAASLLRHNSPGAGGQAPASASSAPHSVKSHFLAFLTTRQIHACCPDFTATAPLAWTSPPPALPSASLPPLLQEAAPHHLIQTAFFQRLFCDPLLPSSKHPRATEALLLASCGLPDSPAETYTAHAPSLSRSSSFKLKDTY